MIMSIDAEKVFDKIYHFVRKTLKNKQARMEGNFLRPIKDIYEKFTANYIMTDWKLSF